MDKEKVVHELAMLYLNNLDLSDISLKELVEKYNQTQSEIKSAFNFKEPQIRSLN